MLHTRTLLEDIRSEIAAVGGRFNMIGILIRESPEWFSLAEVKRVRKAQLANARNRKYKKKNPRTPKSNRNRIWTDEDELYVKKHFGRIRTSRLARYLGRTRFAVAQKFHAIATEEEKQWVAEHGLYAYQTNKLKKK
jgi:hypothetical protein